VNDDVAAVVHAHTDGNPLFMVRLVEHLLDRGWLAENGGLWRLSVDRAAIEQEVPEDIQQLIQGQLRFLSRAERDVLEVASVGGVMFDAPAVAAASAVDSTRSSPAMSCAALVAGFTIEECRVAGRHSRGSLRLRARALSARALRRLSPSRRAILHQQVGER
jgi:predicted ATPase